MDDKVRTGIIVQATDLIDLNKIIVAASRNDDLFHAPLAKSLRHIRTKKSGSTRHNHTPIWKFTHPTCSYLKQ